MWSEGAECSIKCVISCIVDAQLGNAVNRQWNDVSIESRDTLRMTATQNKDDEPWLNKEGRRVETQGNDSFRVVTSKIIRCHLTSKIIRSVNRESNLRDSNMKERRARTNIS